MPICPQSLGTALGLRCKQPRFCCSCCASCFAACCGCCSCPLAFTALGRAGSYCVESCGFRPGLCLRWIMEDPRGLRSHPGVVLAHFLSALAGGTARSGFAFCASLPYQARLPLALLVCILGSLLHCPSFLTPFGAWHAPHSRETLHTAPYLVSLRLRNSLPTLGCVLCRHLGSDRKLMSRLHPSCFLGRLGNRPGLLAYALRTRCLGYMFTRPTTAPWRSL